MNNRMNNRIGYLVLGTILFLINGFIIISAVTSHAPLPNTTYFIVAMMVVCFVMSYLHPQMEQKDERIKLIRQKGMFYSYFAMIFYYLVFILGIQSGSISLSTTQVVSILASLDIVTVFISWVIISIFY